MSWRPATRVWLSLIWPREVRPEQLAAMFRTLATSAGTPMVLEAVGTEAGVRHRIGLPASRSALMSSQLRAQLPGLAITDEPRPVVELTHAVRLDLSTRRRPVTTGDPEAVALGLLTALAHVRGQETLVLQWVLGSRLAPRVVPNTPTGQTHESWLRALTLAPFGTPPVTDSEARTALRAKQGEPGWRALGRIAVQAASRPRQHQLLQQTVNALRAVETGGAHWRVRRERPTRAATASTPLRYPSALNLTETAAVSAWPLGVTQDLPVGRTGHRALRPARAIPAAGRVIGTSTWPGAERSLAISPEDSLRHLHVLGPTGVGKSTLLLNLICQDMAAGRGVVVIEPKHDLISAVLQRVPANRRGDVVVLDPTDEAQPVGINPLATHGRSPELVADQLLAVFHNLYAAHWGPRTQDILHASLLTLAQRPGMTLAALPLLLTDAGFRRRIVGQINDPLALGPFWAGFEAWSDQERTAAISPVMNKLRPFLLRPQLRRVIGTARPRFDIRQVFTNRRILLVDLSKGHLGPEAAALLGSLVVAQLWQATQERSAIDPARRHPVMVFIDEFQDYLHLPTDLGDALAAARGLGVGLTLAHQHLHQLEPAMRSAVLSNARARVCFQLGTEDARLMAQTASTLDAEDFQSLGRYEIYAQLVAHQAVQPWCSARTGPSPQTCSNEVAIRASSRERYGVPAETIDADLTVLLGGGRRPSSVDDLTPRRRGDRQ